MVVFRADLGVSYSNIFFLKKRFRKISEQNKKMSPTTKPPPILEIR